MARINIEISEEIHKKAKLNAIMQNITLAEYIIEAIKDKNKQIEKKR